MATALTGPDRSDTVCRQTAPKVKWIKLLTLRFIGLLGCVALCSKIEVMRVPLEPKAQGLFDALPVSPGPRMARVTPVSFVPRKAREWPEKHP